MKLSERYEKAAALLSGKGKWQREKYGYYLYQYDRRARADDKGCYCMMGAAAKVARVKPGLSEDEIGGEDLHDEIGGFNDAPTTTQDDAVLGCLMLAEYLKSEGL